MVAVDSPPLPLHVSHSLTHSPSFAQEKKWHDELTLQEQTRGAPVTVWQSVMLKCESAWAVASAALYTHREGQADWPPLIYLLIHSLVLEVPLSDSYLYLWLAQGRARHGSLKPLLSDFGDPFQGSYDQGKQMTEIFHLFKAAREQLHELCGVCVSVSFWSTKSLICYWNRWTVFFLFVTNQRKARNLRWPLLLVYWQTGASGLLMLQLLPLLMTMMMMMMMFILIMMITDDTPPLILDAQFLYA